MESNTIRNLILETLNEFEKNILSLTENIRFANSLGIIPDQSNKCRELKQKFNLKDNENVLMFWYQSYDLHYLFITEFGVYLKNFGPNVPNILWENINNDYRKGFRTYDLDKELSLIDRIIFSIASKLKNNIETETPEPQKEIVKIEPSIYEKISNFITSENWDAIINISNEYNEKEKNQSIEIYYFRAYSFLKLNKYSDCIKNFQICKDLFFQTHGYNSTQNNWSKEISDLYYKISELEIEILKKDNKTYDLLWKINEIYYFESNLEKKYDIKENIKTTYNDVIKNFGNLSFENRKVLIFEEDLPSFKTPNILPLTISNVGELKFPPNHPKKGQLYVGHPYRSNVYYPIGNAENQIFEAQVTELTRILQNLGALKIVVEHIQGEKGNLFKTENNFNKEKNSLDINANINVKIHKVNAEYNNNNEVKSETDQTKNYQKTSDKKMSITQTFEMPSEIGLPSDLIWYHHNEVWQSIAQQRLEGKLLSSEIVLSSEKSEVLNEKEIKTIEQEYHNLIKAGYKNLFVNVNVGVKHDKEIENAYKSEIKIQKMETTKWKVYVEFAPLENISYKQTLTSQKSDILSSEKENDYIEFLELALEDGIITEDERKLLEKKRQKLGLSYEIALQLENLIKTKNQFTSEELEYIDILKDCLEDNIISESERKILNKFRDKFNISTKRAIQIENEIIKTLKQ